LSLATAASAHDLDAIRATREEPLGFRKDARLRPAVATNEFKQRGAPREPRRRLRKIGNFLPNRSGLRYRFSERPISPARAPHGGRGQDLGKRQEVRRLTPQPPRPEERRRRVSKNGPKRAGGAAFLDHPSRRSASRAAQDEVGGRGWRSDAALARSKDSEMAPQAIEIAQNGLGNGEPAHLSWEGGIEQADSI
jgi:hypothetical protein